jgi:hypothetical protein
VPLRPTVHHAKASQPRLADAFHLSQAMTRKRIRRAVRLHHIQDRGRELRKHQRVADQLHRRTIDDDHVKRLFQRLEHLGKTLALAVEHHAGARQLDALELGVIGQVGGRLVVEVAHKARTMMLADDRLDAWRQVVLARKLEPGDTVSVEYRRGSDTRTTKIVARDLSSGKMGRKFRVEVPDMPGMSGGGDLSDLPMLPDGPAGFSMIFGGEPGGLALTELNPDLGEYFGAKEGVLVLKTPRDSTLALKAGDVILAIDGRTPTSAAHAQRILRSYDAGETAKLEILRKQKKLTVLWKVPEGEWKRRGPGGGPRKVELEKVERS